MLALRSAHSAAGFDDGVFGRNSVFTVEAVTGIIRIKLNVLVGVNRYVDFLKQLMIITPHPNLIAI
ncbi:MAG: hypothetical protein ACJAS2_002236 [Pseudohongiellaceae bacterium]|jgi:hypothetical protein